MITKKVNETLILELEEPINENMRVMKLDFTGIKHFWVNFDKVDAINSIGVKMWLEYSRLVPKSVSVGYFFCRKVVVDQMNMVAGFMPDKAQIGSFYVPFFCER